MIEANEQARIQHYNIHNYYLWVLGAKGER